MLKMLMGMDEAAMFWLEVDSGMHYIHQQCGGDAAGYKWLIESKEVYWDWWINRWSLRNEEFINYWNLQWSMDGMADAGFKDELLRQYKLHHWRGFNSEELCYGYWQTVKMGLSQSMRSTTLTTVKGREVQHV